MISCSLPVGDQPSHLLDRIRGRAELVAAMHQRHAGGDRLPGSAPSPARNRRRPRPGRGGRGTAPSCARHRTASCPRNRSAPGSGSRRGTKLPAPAAITTTGASSTVPASVVSRQCPSGSRVSAEACCFRWNCGSNGRDLLHQAVDQLLAGAAWHGRDVVDRLVGIEFGALAADLVEIVDQMALHAEQAGLEHGEQAARAGADDDHVGPDDVLGHDDSAKARRRRGAVELQQARR